ncbi:unnamed protein product [Rotaria magnacalcarata]|uniref:Mixed lineage kinase domain-containing protein n=1 Tax=Rotaria magnacalcarata TaxID=392030 RepID=A0A816PTA4_9BILA|nr:unnamed protein product [Rotaria magnacalcarata]CAF2052307.1 unnamed protein product [Rotaria magnacalcarata]CAF4967309.1 unnamed protein product [Rotaria magnacalcarata]CAF5110328.1 unnamed protein product [Rotaria magnacalcarata]
MKQTVKDVKANEQQCARLVERINAICMALKSVNDRDLQRLELRKSLSKFRICVEECVAFVNQFADEKSWFIRVFKNQNYQEQYEEFNLQLSQCAADLNIGINLKQIFDAKQDLSDQI